MKRTLVSPLKTLTSIGCLALLAACAATAPPVRSDYDRAANFTGYRTFGFPESPGTDRGGYTTLTTSRFKDAVRREMSVRGYTYSETSPDLLVNFYSEVRDRTRVYSYPWFGPTFAYPYAFGYPYGYGYYRGRPRYGYFSAWPFYEPGGVDVVQYQSSRLKVDVVEAPTKKVIWEASVEEPLSDQEQDNPQPVIDRLVGEMFKKFPRTAAQQPSS